MAKIFRIDMLPAREGDCLWIEYGDEDHPHRILIDGGRQSAYNVVKARFAALPDGQREFELAILTHVDADHIEGFLKLLEDSERGVTFKDFWFNAFHHLDPEGFVTPGEDDDLESFGAVQGEKLTKGLVEQKWAWNMAFNQSPIVVPDEGKGYLPTIMLPGGMKLTIVSPTWEGLQKMQPRWEREVKRAGLVPGTHIPDELPLEDDEESFGGLDKNEVHDLAALNFRKDTSPANGSSIAVIAEFEGKRAFLTGDAHANVLEKTLARLPEFNQDGIVKIDAFKISHHGSRKTLSTELVRMVDCHTYLISTDGSRHHHPDREAIARILEFGQENKAIFFNYRTDETEAWDRDDLKSEFSYSTQFPEITSNGEVRVELL